MTRLLTHRLSLALLTCAVSLARGLGSSVCAQEKLADPSKAQTAHYVVTLNLNEFSILNVSEMDGLLKYGGSGDFQLRMAREGTNVVWTITIDNPRLMELLGIFVGEKTIKLVQSLEPNNIDPNQKIALQAIKTLTQKLEFAQRNPVWDAIKLSGTVLQQGTNWSIEASRGTFKLAGPKVDELKGLNGQPVVADGFVKIPGQLEVTRFLVKKPNTVELFVMSFCPFGQRAETALYNYLAQTNLNPKPNVELHFIFYKQKKDGKDVFVSLHGEEELTENLVQMVIRDRFSQMLEPYVRLRSSSGKLPWSKLAENVGLTPENVAEIEKAITGQREPLLQQEYDYVSGRYDIFDGSPTYVWESERIADLKKVATFKGLEGSTQDACSQ